MKSLPRVSVCVTCERAFMCSVRLRISILNGWSRKLFWGHTVWSDIRHGCSEREAMWVSESRIFQTGESVNLLSQGISSFQGRQGAQTVRGRDEVPGTRPCASVGLDSVSGFYSEYVQCVDEHKVSETPTSPVLQLLLLPPSRFLFKYSHPWGFILYAVFIQKGKGPNVYW